MKNNVILGITCAALTGIAAFVAVKLLKKKIYIDITEICREMDDYLDNNKSK